MYWYNTALKINFYFKIQDNLLHCQWLEREYDRAIKSGFFIDFITKKIAESFVRNVFISGGYIFGEKYIIEHITKGAADRLILLVRNTYSNILDSNKYTVYFFLLSSLYLVGFVFILNLLFV